MRARAVRRFMARWLGYGLSGDAHHITAPADGHDGAFRAMRAAFKQRRAGAGRRAVCQRAWHLHAYGRRSGACEAVERFFGDDARGLAMSSTKSATGHLLGAAGAVESIFSLLAIRDGVTPPTLNLEQPSRESVIDRVALETQERTVDCVLSNSFGFGGTNASIIFRRV